MANNVNGWMGLPKDSEIKLIPVDDTHDPIFIRTTKVVVFQKKELELYISPNHFGRVQSYSYDKLLYPIYNGIPIKRIEWNPDITGLYK